MHSLEQALLVSSYLRYRDDANRYGMIGDIAFFVHLQYDQIRDQVHVIQLEDTESRTIEETPARICYTRGLQAIQKAYEAERLSAESMMRRQKGIERPTAKALLYREIEARFKRLGVQPAAPPLLDVPREQPNSLAGMSQWAAKESRVTFGETKAFQFFDFLGNMFIPKYGLAKQALKLIAS